MQAAALFHAGRIALALLRQRINGSHWSDIARAAYTYYADTDFAGSVGDLRWVSRLTPDWAGCWKAEGTEMCHYYKLGESNVFAHGLKNIVRPAAFERLATEVADPFAGCCLFMLKWFFIHGNQRNTHDTQESSSEKSSRPEAPP